MSKTRLYKKLCELSKECERLARRAEFGMLTEDEKRRKCNKLASEYLNLAKPSKKYVNPYVDAYIRSACFRIGLELKTMGAKPEKSTRKSPVVHTKVIRY